MNYPMKPGLFGLNFVPDYLKIIKLGATQPVKVVSCRKAFTTNPIIANKNINNMRRKILFK